MRFESELVDIVKKSFEEKGFLVDTEIPLQSDFVYIAIDSDFAHRVKKELLQKYGIGFIVVDSNSMKILLSPRPSTIVHQTMKRDLTFLGGKSPSERWGMKADNLI